MATTSPDNLYSPDSSDPYALTQDLGAMQDSVQTALVRRANAYVGTSAQRNAFTTAPVGTIWSDTNGSRLVYKRGASSWEELAPEPPVTPDTGWNSLPLSTGTGSLRWRAIGDLVEVSLNVTGASIPVNASSLSSSALPANYRPSSLRRGVLILNNQFCNMYVTPAGIVNAYNPTGAVRNGGEGSVLYMLG